jgi:hypothetical protein
LAINGSTINITINSNITGAINTNPTVVQSGSSLVYNISNLGGTLSLLSVPVQILTITISTLIQPSSAINISPFTIETYCTSNNYMTAKGSAAQVIQIKPGSITNSTLVSNTTVTFS